MTDQPADEDAFTQHRPMLLGVAYRILGSVAEAEDAVQEAWLRWRRADRERVVSPRAYLVRVVTRTAIDQLRRASAKREVYVGPWLPEPMLTGPDVAEEATLADTVSMAMLVVLETLSPLERAVFVLREAFGFPFPEIARALGRSESAVRQLAHRSREHVQARRPRFAQDPGVRRAATERFLAAAVGGDLEALLEVLAPEVTLVADGGGKVRAPQREIHGREKVSRWLAARGPAGMAGMEIGFVTVNGGPGAVVSAAGVAQAVVTVDVDPETGKVVTIRMVGNPDKLAGVAADAERAAGPDRGR